MQESSIWQNCTLCLLYPHSWTLKVSWDSDERVNPSESFCNARLASREHLKMSRTKIWSTSLFWTHPFIGSYKLWLTCPGIENIVSWCQPACWWVKRNYSKIMRQLWEGSRNSSHSSPELLHRNLLSEVSLAGAVWGDRAVRDRRLNLIMWCFVYCEIHRWARQLPR